MSFRPLWTVRILFAPCLLLCMVSCSSVRMMTPDAAGVASNEARKPRRVRIAGYERTGGRYERFVGHVSPAGDSLRFIGVAPERGPAYEVAVVVPRDSVSQVAVKQFSVVRTMFLALGLWAGFAIGVLIAWAGGAGLQ